MEKQTDENKFILKSLQEDFQYLFATYEKQFTTIDRIILFQTNPHSDDRKLQYPVYVWHNMDRQQCIEHQQVLMNQIEGRILRSTNNEEEITLSQIETNIDEFTHDTEFFFSNPIIIEDQFDGFLCFEKKQQKAWTKEEKGFLSAFSISIVHTLLYMDNQKYSETHNWVMNEIINQINDIIYITDLDTDEILYMNQKMKDTFQIKNPLHKQCWKVLHPELEERCFDCLKSKLLESKEAHPLIVREQYFPETGKTFENYDCLMKWNDGRIVHLHHALDVSERKQLYEEANYDELTLCYTRRKGKSELENTLHYIKQSHRLFSICMIDLNNLKYINDHYGHLEGDRLLTSVSEEIRKDLQKDDYICRLSGDEFFIVLMNTRKEEAIFRMNNILEALHQRKLFPQENREQEFCFGCVEVGPSVTYRVKDLLSEVDEQLYDNKRSYHITQAEERLYANETKTTSLDFVYDKDLLYEALLKSTDDYIFINNMQTGIFCYPQNMVDEFDLPGRVIDNAAAVWSTKIHENDKRTFLEANQVITDGRASHHTVEYRAKNRHGEWIWLRCRGNAMKNEKGETVLFAGIITNMGRQNKVDNTTSLFNKHAFENKVEEMLRSNPDEKFTMMLLNIDDFKRINSLNSRSYGDGVIKHVAQKIQTMLTPSQSIYRLDGDEFGIIIRSEDQNEAKQLFQKIKKNFQSIQTHENKNYFISFSCGSATSQIDADNFTDLNKYADYALDQAKANGKNQYVAFTKDILDVKKRAQEIIEILRTSIENNFEGFSVHYQVIVHHDFSVSGAEALARFYCEKYGDIYPMEFISLLEDSNLIVKFGKWILEEAMKTVHHFKKYIPDFKMGVNLSIRQIENDDFAAFVKKTLKKYEIPPCNLVLELTESCIAKNFQQLADMVKKLRTMKVLVVMDDFGTGYSSLGLLKEIPIDILKIDKLFVTGIKENGFDYSFIKLVVEMCQTLKIETLLEGIEEENECLVAKQLCLTYFQGFYFGKPVPANEFEKQHLIK